MKRVCLYCGSNHGARPEYTAAARRCGALLASRGIAVVFGGGHVGLMKEAADAALAAGGTVLGFIPRHLSARGVAHRGITTLVEVDSMHERKHQMAEAADAFIALPGGIGTLEEVFEVLTWLQLGLHHKPVGLLNTAGFYAPLLEFLRHMQAERFLKKEHLEMLLVEDEVEPLLDRLTHFKASNASKWEKGAAG